jgi:hypothetical protein
VSHQPERKEKDCLNCGNIVHGRFCHVCGQENIITHQNFFSLTQHFIYDVLHFDGKFFDTLRHLLFKPGFVAKEYIKGKRAKYLDPIRMYLFTSAIFFVVFFSVNKIDPSSKETLKKVALTNEERIEMIEDYTDDMDSTAKDTLRKQKIALLADTTKPVLLADVLISDGFVISNRSYKSASEYDSIQRLLPKNEKDGWLKRKIMLKGVELNQRYDYNSDLIFKSILNTFFHQFPYMLFISLPFFAGLLKLLYIRRKNFYYSDHAVFTIYHYILTFIILLISFGLRRLENFTDWSFFNWLIFMLFIGWTIYFYKGLRNFYQQSRAKTIIKFLLLNFIGFWVIVFLLTLFFLISAYQT